MNNQSIKVGTKRLAAFLCILLIFAAVFFTFRLPQIPDDLNKIALSNPTLIYADAGQIVKVLADRDVVPLDQISPMFLNAVLVMEDQSYYRHHGVSKRGLLRALFADLKSMSIREGGSSITQQLAKNLFFGFDRSWLRKIKETLIALQIENQFTKQQILEAYVNQINFGSGVYGVDLAAQTYFAKHADELDLSEATILAAIPRWPLRYNPYNNQTAAKERQALILKRMQEEGHITGEQVQTVLAETLKVQRINPLQGNAEYFVDEVRKAASQKYGSDAVNYGGLHMYTTMNSRYQYEASRAIEEGMARLDELMGLPPYSEASWDNKAQYPQAALAAIDPRSGAIKALVGGRDFRRAPFDRALANNRHAGSSFKPFTYFAVLDKGIAKPTTVYVDEPSTFTIGSRQWSPDNFTNDFLGPIVVKYALMNSVNIITAKLIDLITPATVVDYAHLLGITSPLEPNLSLALGAAGVSPVEMANAYATIASGGIWRQAYLVSEIKVAEGHILEKWEMQSKRAADPQTCYLMIDMLRGVVEGGTARGVRSMGFYRPCAGKTGTSNEFRDAWFVGFTPELVTAVWVGFDDNHPMRDKNGVGITGARGALPIWALFMQRALENLSYSDFPIPPGIEFVDVDPRTGSGPLPGGPSLTVAVRANR
jgi:1A family penicillin-binding protein